MTEAEKKEAERYTQWFARMLKQLMDCKVEQLNNIQVILKGTDEKDKYIFSVISNEALQTFNDEKVRKALEYLGEYPYTRIGADYLNIYENVVMNILKHRSQELLLKKVLKNNLDSDNAGQIVTAYWIYVVMLYSALVKKDKDLQGNGGKVIEMGSITVMDSGFAFMKDMADDLARKKSAFWNCKVDAFLCPACAFVYAASPLGFTLLGQRFAFMNTNSSINQLLASNSRSGKIVTEVIKSFL